MTCLNNWKLNISFKLVNAIYAVFAPWEMTGKLKTDFRILKLLWVPHQRLVTWEKAWPQPSIQVPSPSVPISDSILCFKGPSSACVWSLQFTCTSCPGATLRTKGIHTGGESTLKRMAPGRQPKKTLEASSGPFGQRICRHGSQHAVWGQRSNYVLLAPHMPHSVWSGWPEPEQEPLKCWAQHRSPSYLNLNVEPSLGPARSGTVQPDELRNHTKGLAKGNPTAKGTCCSVPSVPGTGL